MARLSFISFCAAAALATLGAPLWAQNQETLFVDGASVDLSDYVWQKRVLVIFRCAQKCVRVDLSLSCWARMAGAICASLSHGRPAR